MEPSKEPVRVSASDLLDTQRAGPLSSPGMESCKSHLGLECFGHLSCFVGRMCLKVEPIQERVRLRPERHPVLI